MEDDYIIQFDGNKSIGLYNLKNDCNLEQNLIEDQNLHYQPLENKIKAIIQSYEERVVQNKFDLN